MNCCKPLVLRVVGVDATANPVTLTVNRPLTEMAANHCFKLIMLPCSLSSVNTNPVSLTDGTNTYPMVAGCSGDVLRYDSLVKYVNRRGACQIQLDCFLGNDGDPADVIHVTVNNRMCASTYVAAAPAVAATVATADIAVASRSAKKTDAA